MPKTNNNGEKVTLRDHIQALLTHQTEILKERAGAHTNEHLIHEEAHKREHSEAKQAIAVATSALDKRLDTLEAQFHKDLGDVSKELKTLSTERTSARGYILGVGAVLAAVVLAANFLLPLLMN